MHAYNSFYTSGNSGQNSSVVYLVSYQKNQ